MGLIRFLLAVAVVAAHTHAPIAGIPFFGGGVLAVQAFFAISGFYMALVVNTKYRSNPRDFYFNRFIRIMPMYWCCVLMEIVIGSGWYLARGKGLGWAGTVITSSLSPWEWLHAAFANVTAIGIDLAILKDRIVGSQVSDAVVSTVGWSLSAELVFYALAPWIVKSGQRLWSCFAVFLLIRLLVLWSTSMRWTVWEYYFLPATFVFFITGALLGLVYCRFSKSSLFKYQCLNLGILATCALVIGGYSWLFSSRLFDLSFPFFFALGIPFIFHLSKDWHWDRALGEYSYPLYLTHHVIISCWSPLRHIFPSEVQAESVLVLSLAISWALLRADNRISRRFKRELTIARCEKHQTNADSC